MIRRGEDVEAEFVGPPHDPLEGGSVFRCMEVNAELNV
jgi:hypothetical protein